MNRQPVIKRWGEYDEEKQIKISNGVRRIRKQEGFRITRGGMSRDQLQRRLQDYLDRKTNTPEGRNKEYKITVVYENIGPRGHQGEGFRRGGVLQLYEPSDSNISEDDAGKIVSFFILSWE